jgi:hypothetical protein
MFFLGRGIFSETLNTRKRSLLIEWAVGRLSALPINLWTLSTERLWTRQVAGANYLNAEY